MDSSPPWVSVVLLRAGGGDACETASVGAVVLLPAPAAAVGSSDGAGSCVSSAAVNVPAASPAASLPGFGTAAIDPGWPLAAAAAAALAALPAPKASQGPTFTSTTATRPLLALTALFVRSGFTGWVGVLS